MQVGDKVYLKCVVREIRKNKDGESYYVVLMRSKDDGWAVGISVTDEDFYTEGEVEAWELKKGMRNF